VKPATGGEGGELAVRVGEVASQLGTSVTARRRRGTGGCGSRETGEREATENSSISISWCDKFFRWVSYK
jgi:hypothetical protein